MSEGMAVNVNARRLIGGFTDACAHLKELRERDEARPRARFEAVMDFGTDLLDWRKDEFAENIGGRLMTPEQAFLAAGFHRRFAARAQARDLLREPEVMARVIGIRAAFEKAVMTIYDEDYGTFWGDVLDVHSRR